MRLKRILANKKLFIICAALTACSLLLWRIAGAQADIAPPPPWQAELETRLVLAASEAPAMQTAASPHMALDELLAEAKRLGSGGHTDEPPPNERIAGPGVVTAPTLWETPPLLALTFDDGPSKVFTPVLLDGLRERGVHVTFFMLGLLAEKAPEIVLTAYEDGHAIGGHSYDHRSNFTKLSASELQTQLQKTDDIIAGITGEGPPFLVRPPNGKINEEIAKQTGKANILWNVDPRDWAVRDADAVCAAIIEGAVDGGVVILHDIHETSVQGALQAIDALLAEGWQFVTVPELYAAYDITLQAGGVYRSPKN